MVLKSGKPGNVHIKAREARVTSSRGAAVHENPDGETTEVTRDAGETLELPVPALEESDDED